MSEFDKSHLQSFITQVDDAAKPRRQIVEAARLQILEAAQNKLKAYQEEVKTVQPEAERVLDTTIFPWWREFKDSELYQQIVVALKEKRVSFKLLLNDEIPYYWPDQTIKELKAKKPFIYKAEQAVKRLDVGVNIDEVIAEYAQPNFYDEWIANFYFSGIGDDFHRFSFEPWNESRESWIFSVHVQQLHLSLNPRREKEDLFARLNPSVYVD